MSLNVLKLNENKTEVVIFGNFVNNHSDSAPGPLSCYCKTNVRNLGVHVNGSFKLCSQVSAAVQSSIIHQRQLAKVKPHLPANVFEHVIRLFITCRLDYRNSLVWTRPPSVVYSWSKMQLLTRARNCSFSLYTGSLFLTGSNLNSYFCF